MQGDTKKIPRLRFPEFSGEWGEKRLSSCLRVKHGRSQKEVEIEDGVYPILATGGEIGRTNTYLYDKPSVLIGRKGTIDKPMYMDTPFWTVDTLFYTQILERECTPKFVYYSFMRINWKRYCEASGVPSLSATTISKIKTHAPKIEEQKKITGFLTTVDDKITALQKKKELLDKYKKGVMQKIFRQEVRFKHYTDGHFSDWQEMRLGECLKVKHGRSQKDVQVANGRYPILATSGEIGRTNTPIYEQPSVLIGRKGTIDRPQYMTTPFWTVDTLFYTKVSERCYPKFLYYLFLRINWKRYNEGSGVPSLSASTISKIKIEIPYREEQQRIADFLTSLDTKIDLISKELGEAKQFKKGLLQQMIV